MLLDISDKFFFFIFCKKRFHLRRQVIQLSKKKKIETICKRKRNSKKQNNY